MHCFSAGCPWCPTAVATSAQIAGPPAAARSLARAHSSTLRFTHFVSTTEERLMTTDQERKAEVLKFSNGLRDAAVAKVTISYYGNGDEGRAEPPQFQDAAGNPVEESRLPADLDLQTLGDLLEGFTPEGYEDGEGGFGTITFDLGTLLIHVEHNWYETVSHPDEPREI